MESVDIELLINLVRVKPFLYDKTDKGYKIPTMKDDAWKEIGDSLRTEASNCEKIWKNLKDRFTRERKKMKRIRASGNIHSSIKNWAWYKDLLFLDSCIQERIRPLIFVKDNTMANGNGMLTYSEISQTDVKSECIDVRNESISAEEFPELTKTEEFSESIPESREEVGPTSTKQRRLLNTGIRKEENKVDLQILETLQHINQNRDNDEQAFGDLVAIELSRVQNLTERTGLKHNIMQILYSK